MHVRYLSWGFIAGIALLAAGCGGEKGTGTQPDPVIRFVNASPTAQNLDFVLNEDRIAANVPYLGSMPDFREFEFRSDNEGGYDFAVRVAGGILDLDVQNQAFARDTNNLIVSIGLPNPGGEFQKRTQILPFSISRVRPVGNRSILIILNALVRSTGVETPPITFQSIIPGDPTSIDNPQFREENINYGSIGNLVVDSGNRTFIARRGETDALFQFAQATFNLAPGGIYLVVIGGQEGNATPALQPSLRFIEIQPED